MKTKTPDHAANFAREYPETWTAFETLADRCHEEGPLDAKTCRLVKLGIAFGARLEGGVHAQVRNAVAEGITRAEVQHVVLLGLTTLGFPTFMAALTWVNDILKLRRRGHKGGKGK